MKEQRIVIDIDAEGRLTAEAEGFAGDLCVKDLEKLLADIAAPWEQVDRKPQDRAAQVAGQRKLEVGKKR